jgi:hypothetical protein
MASPRRERLSDLILGRSRRPPPAPAPRQAAPAPVPRQAAPAPIPAPPPPRPAGPPPPARPQQPKPEDARNVRAEEGDADEALREEINSRLDDLDGPQLERLLAMIDEGVFDDAEVPAAEMMEA